MNRFVNWLDALSQRAFSKLKWLLSVLSGALAASLVMVLEAQA
jgi:hypothetical protein